MDSLLPRIWAVEAVGMGEMRRLFLTPYLGTTGTVRETARTGTPRITCRASRRHREKGSTTQVALRVKCKWN